MAKCLNCPQLTISRPNSSIGSKNNNSHCHIFDLIFDSINNRISPHMLLNNCLRLFTRTFPGELDGRVPSTAIFILKSEASRYYSSKLSPKMTSGNLVWIDMEMTGLDHNKDKIMEIACIVTDKDLNILDKGIDLVIHQPDDVLRNMNEWCIEHHGKVSGGGCIPLI